MKIRNSELIPIKIAVPTCLMIIPLISAIFISNITVCYAIGIISFGIFLRYYYPSNVKRFFTFIKRLIIK